jgi:hypothetical protein
LAHQLGKAIETVLWSKEFEQTHGCLFAIQVTVKIEEVCFEEP